MAGFVLEEIDVSVDQNKLTIRGERKREDDATYEYLHRELPIVTGKQIGRAHV